MPHEQLVLLVDRFEPGNTFTIEEFKSVLTALITYSKPDSPFHNFATENLHMAELLDQNTALIELVEEDEVLYTRVSPGINLGLH